MRFTRSSVMAVFVICLVSSIPSFARQSGPIYPEPKYLVRSDTDKDYFCSNVKCGKKITRAKLLKKAANKNEYDLAEYYCNGCGLVHRGDTVKELNPLLTKPRPAVTISPRDWKPLFQIGRAKQPIIGTWSDRQYTFKFLADGTFTLSGNDSCVSNWHVLVKPDGDIVVVENMNGWGMMYFQWRLIGGDLHLREIEMPQRLLLQRQFVLTRQK